MRGLPPVPVDVAQLTQVFDINGHDTSISFWLFNPSFAAATIPALARTVSDWFIDALVSVLELQHLGVIPTTCRLAVRGLAYVTTAPPSHGAWTGGQADNVAVGLHWMTGEYGKGLSPITYVPGVPDAFVTDNWRVNELAIGNLLASGQDLYNALNGLRSPDDTPTVVGTVHRARAGAPLSVATFAPYVGVVPTAKVVTIRRRIPHSRQVSPS